MTITSTIIVAGQAKSGAGIMSKSKRVRKAGSKSKKPQSWEAQHGALSVRSDVGVYERWGHKIGVERIDEADQTRRQTLSFAMLALRDRAIDAGGIVTAEAAVNECEHLVLDPLRKAGVLDDPLESRRADWRVAAGIAMMGLWIEGKIMSKSTSGWRDVGGGSGGRISEAEAEGKEARSEMRYLRALDALGEHSTLIQAVCCSQVVPPKTRRPVLLTALDLLAEELHGIDPPAGIVRPRLRIRDRQRMG